MTLLFLLNPCSLVITDGTVCSGSLDSNLNKCAIFYLCLLIYYIYQVVFESHRYFFLFLFSAIRNAVGILSNKISALREDYFIHGSAKLNPFVC